MMGKRDFDVGLRFTVECIARPIGHFLDHRCAATARPRRRSVADACAAPAPRTT